MTPVMQPPRLLLRYISLLGLVGLALASCSNGSGIPVLPSGEPLFECDDPNLNDCDPLVQCLERRDGYVCGRCPPHTRDVRGNGTLCTPFDTCEERFGYNPCSEHTSCVIENRNPACTSCPQGFEDVFGNGTVCRNRNECLSPRFNDCDPLVRCIDTEGSYECGDCPPGFQEVLDEEEGRSRCLDVDECTLDTPRLCEHGTCINVPGTFLCECGLGFAQSDDLRSCRALISELRVAPGSLVPPFEPATREYTYAVPLEAGTTTVSFEASPGVAVEVMTPDERHREVVVEQAVSVDARMSTIVVRARLGEVDQTYRLRPSRTHLISAPSRERGDRFAASLSALALTRSSGSRLESRGLRLAIGSPGAEAARGLVWVGSLLVNGARDRPLLDQEPLRLSNGSPGDYFGASVATWWSATNGQDRYILVVGAPGVADRRGEAYVYAAGGSGPFGPDPLNRLPTSDPLPGGGLLDLRPGDEFGFAIDGTWRLGTASGFLAVGAPGCCSAGAGAVFIYEVSNARSPVLLDVLSPSDAEASRFGERISLSGDTLAVGYRNSSASFVGAELFEFEGSGDGSIRVAPVCFLGRSHAEGAFSVASLPPEGQSRVRAVISTPEGTDLLEEHNGQCSRRRVFDEGGASSWASEKLVLGLPDPSASRTGGAARLLGRGWTEEYSVTSGRSDFEEDFGLSVDYAESLVGPWLFVGAPGAEDGRGALYVFEPNL